MYCANFQSQLAVESIFSTYPYRIMLISTEPYRRTVLYVLSPGHITTTTSNVMKVRKEPKEAIKVSEVTASHYIMCKSPVIFFISAVPYVSGCHFLN